MTKEKEIMNYINHFEKVRSVTEADNKLLVATANPNQFVNPTSDPIFTFKTTFDHDMYTIHVCDERLLYSSLLAWRDLRLTSLFQGDHEVIYDNTYGKLEFAERENYISTLRVAQALLSKNVYYVGELYEMINRMIEYQSFKPFGKVTDKKLSEEFFRENYLPLLPKAYNKKTGENDIMDIREYPKDIREFANTDRIKNPEKVLRRYYKKK